MARKGSSLLMSFVLLGLVSQSFIAPISARKLEEFSDEKSYYSPSTPHHSSKPTSPTPTYGGHTTPTPTPKYGSPSPKYGSPTPSGGSYTPPSGGSYTPPSGGSYTPPTTTPSTPIPSIGTCDYWKKNPDLIKSLIGYWGTVSQFFGPACSVVFGGNPSLIDALGNKRTDGIGALFREGTAAFLNSIACKSYPFSTPQVKNSFAAAIISDGAAAAQAELFKRANEGKFKL
ncbi:protodermal factor 1-like [Typha latifolia]|uniref:protodermal factor 1-like n=1 Tax=Typha latifolia TaxID=4733 RepID=UPI003C2EC680